MHLLFLNHNVAWSGGTFFRAFQLARSLVGRGHSVTLLSISPKNRLRIDSAVHHGVTVVETPDLTTGRLRTGWDPWGTAVRSWLLRNARASLVHAFDCRPSVILPALLATRSGIPLFTDWADWWGRGGTTLERAAGRRLRPLIEPVETWFEEAFRSRAVGTTVISAALEQRAVGLGIPHETILTLPGGSRRPAANVPSREECRRMLGFNERSPLLGYLGALSIADARTLLDAHRQVLRNRRDARLVLVGRPGIPDPGVDGVLFTGFVSDEQKWLWLGACDVLLLPLAPTLASRARWPSKVNDYLMTERPIVAMNVGDVGTWLSTHDAAVVVEPTADALATEALALLDNTGRQLRIAANALRLGDGPLHWDSLADTLDDFYHRRLGLR